MNRANEPARLAGAKVKRFSLLRGFATDVTQTGESHYDYECYRVFFHLPLHPKNLIGNLSFPHLGLGETFPDTPGLLLDSFGVQEISKKSEKSKKTHTDGF
jgi:hypothetical protein